MENQEITTIKSNQNSNFIGRNRTTNSKDRKSYKYNGSSRRQTIRTHRQSRRSMLNQQGIFHWIIGIGEGEVTEVNVIEHTINKIIAEFFPKLRKNMHIQTEEIHKITSRQDQKRKSLWPIIVKTLSIQNKRNVY